MSKRTSFGCQHVCKGLVCALKLLVKIITNIYREIKSFIAPLNVLGVMHKYNNSAIIGYELLQG